MGKRDPKREELKRLELKSLDARFLTEIQHGLNCSAFEAEAVLGVVRETYFGFLDEHAATGPPGVMSVVAVDADEPSGKPLNQCAKQTVRLRVHRGSGDDQTLQQQGAQRFRQQRIPELCQEALSQGGLLTREDLAYRIFFVSPRTITRDLRTIREQHPDVPVPLRSTMHDIGPVLTHRVKIVQLALEGKTMSEICRIMHHSPAAVSNYLSTFVRCAQLVDKKMQVRQIAFLLRRGPGLIQQYVDLVSECVKDETFTHHLEQMLATASGVSKKKEQRRGSNHDS